MKGASAAPAKPRQGVLAVKLAMLERIVMKESEGRLEEEGGAQSSELRTLEAEHARDERELRERLREAQEELAWVRDARTQGEARRASLREQLAAARAEEKALLGSLDQFGVSAPPQPEAVRRPVEPPDASAGAKDIASRIASLAASEQNRQLRPKARQAIPSDVSDSEPTKIRQILAAWDDRDDDGPRRKVQRLFREADADHDQRLRWNRDGSEIKGFVAAFFDAYQIQLPQWTNREWLDMFHQADDDATSSLSLMEAQSLVQTCLKAALRRASLV